MHGFFACSSAPPLAQSQTRLPAHSPHTRTQHRPFIWNGQDYLLKVGPDLAFLDFEDLSKRWLNGRSPAADPFAPMASPTPQHPAPVSEADPLRVRMATTVLRRARDRSAVDLVRASLISPGESRAADQAAIAAATTPEI